MLLFHPMECGTWFLSRDAIDRVAVGHRITFHVKRHIATIATLKRTPWCPRFRGMYRTPSDRRIRIHGIHGIYLAGSVGLLRLGGLPGGRRSWLRRARAFIHRIHRIEIWGRRQMHRHGKRIHFTVVPQSEFEAFRDLTPKRLKFTTQSSLQVSKENTFVPKRAKNLKCPSCIIFQLSFGLRVFLPLILLFAAVDGPFGIESTNWLPHRSCGLHHPSTPCFTKPRRFALHWALCHPEDFPVPKFQCFIYYMFSCLAVFWFQCLPHVFFKCVVSTTI